MHPWIGLAATLAWNYSRHLRGKSTICSVSRRIPKVVLVPAYTAGAAGLAIHVYRGYEAIVEAIDA